MSPAATIYVVIGAQRLLLSLLLEEGGAQRRMMGRAEGAYKNAAQRLRSSPLQEVTFRWTVAGASGEGG